jgi:Ty3 transposon capsid-like protein
VKASQDQVILTIREEMNSRLSHLESKLDKVSITPPGKGILPTPEHTLSTFRPHPVHDKGDHLVEESEFLRRDNRFQFPRSDCPRFSGENTTEWLRKCQSFFELHQVPVQYRTHLATMQFHDSVSEWYDGYLISHDPPEWNELIRLVASRFKKINSKNSLEELKGLNQLGYIEEYWQHFEKLKSRLLLEGRQFTDKDFIDVFISGLKGEIKPFVLAFDPQTLDAALNYALYMESATECQYKRLKQSTKFNPYNNISMTKTKSDTIPTKAQASSVIPKPSLIDQRRALG